jgi:hypothetical protein
MLRARLVNFVDIVRNAKVTAEAVSVLGFLDDQDLGGLLQGKDRIVSVCLSLRGHLMKIFVTNLFELFSVEKNSMFFHLPHVIIFFAFPVRR